MSLKIAYLTSKDPHDKIESSGVYYYQSASLRDHCGDVVYLGPVKSNFIYWYRRLFNLINRFTRKTFNHSHSILLSRIYARIFAKKIKGTDFDIIFSDKTSCEIAYLKTEIPIVYSTDATFHLLKNYYPEFSNLFKWSVWEAQIIERKAINNASLVICTSEWAKASIIDVYDFPAERVFVLPRGANIDRVIDTERIYRRRKTNVCKLLFIGRDLSRKGYPIAFGALKYMQSKGYKAHLTVVGGIPPSEMVDDSITVIPYIDKNTPEGMTQFEGLMYESNFYVLPTRAEAMGIAFCEASAYGLPIITTNTGGVTQVVKNGVNGFALSVSADADEYGQKIIDIFFSDDVYYNLVKSSRTYFDEALNWDVWGKNFKKILDEFLEKAQMESSHLKTINIK